MIEPFRIFGQPVPRVDGAEKSTGRALYAADVTFPGMLHVKVLWSDRPHARLLRIHTEKAERSPDVVAVLTHRDIPGTNRVGPRIKDQPVLCDDRICRIGDPVALVAAETAEDAEMAIERIGVDYEDLPGVFSPEEALGEGAIQIHPSGNLLLDRTLLKGDPEGALEEAEIVISRTYRTQMVEHACLEPEAGVARFENGKMMVWMPSKHAHFDHRELAAVLGLPPEKVRVILPAIGGSFGEKQCLGPGYFAALASFKTGRPCKMVYSREESFWASTKRHPFTIHYTTGATRQGHLLAVKVEILADTGAYAAQGNQVLTRTLTHAAGPYEIPNVYTGVRGVYTNNPVGSAMRGFGVPQLLLAFESQMDLLAERLNMDPFEIRLKNALRPGSFTATGQCLGPSVGLGETITAVREVMAKRKAPDPSGSKRYGWGIASMAYGIGITGVPNPGLCRAEADESGDFTLFFGCGDVGQGAATVMLQIAAEELKTTTDRIKFVMGDTELCPDSGTSTASRVTYIVGRSMQLAAQNLRELLQEAAASVIEIAREGLSFDGNAFYAPEAPRRRVSVSEVVQRLKRRGVAAAAEGRFDPETRPLDEKTAQGHPYATYAFATQGALVSVDVESGEVDVLDLVACHDVGKVVNPIHVEGQIQGGISMGLGYGLMEEVLLDKGLIRNPRFREYRLPTALDLPEVTPLIVEAEEPTGPFGAKGVGEPALLPTAPAIVNAIASATGIRVQELPVTAERVWRLLQQNRKARESIPGGSASPSVERPGSQGDPPAGKERKSLKKRHLEQLVDRVVEADLLVIGGGLAGAMAVNVALDQGVRRVVLVDKGKVARSGQSTFAAGAWAMPLPGDDLNVWIEETIRSGEYINDQEWVKLLWEKAHAVGIQLHRWGEDFGARIFELNEVGELMPRKGRGHQKTSHVTMNPLPMMETLKKRAVEKGAHLFERVMVNDLVVHRGVGVGALGFHYRTGETILFPAKATILASAGCAFHAPFMGERNLTGDLQAAALRAGVLFRNMEIWSSNTGGRDYDIHGSNLFVGAGGRWFNGQDEEFMLRYDPLLGNRAKQQTKCIALAREVHEGRGPIHFDLTGVTPSDQALLRKILPETFRKWDRAGIRPFEERIPWISAFLGTVESGGGIDINLKCETQIPGFYAAGDITCEPPHGGFAFGGLNIAFAAVSGHEAATHAAHALLEAPPIDWKDQALLTEVDVLRTRMMSPLVPSTGTTPDEVVHQLLKTIIPYRVSYIKNETTLRNALREIERIREEACLPVRAQDLHELVKAHEARNMVEIAEVMVHAALFRKESRSYHFREDFPISDNLNWLKWVMVRKDGENIQLSTREIPWIYPQIRPPLGLMRPPNLRIT